jgi:site-specific recombinase XerD
MAQYLAVRDAAVGGRHGALLLTTALYEHRPVNPTATSAAEELTLLCKFAGLPEGVYSSYSTRKGYAAQAVADGWDVEDIAAGLRHQRLDTTRLYTGDIDVRAVVQRMIADEPEEAA